MMFQYIIRGSIVSDDKEQVKKLLIWAADKVHATTVEIDNECIILRRRTNESI